MWMSMIADGHDICCGCDQPFAHLLDSIFPEGHKDRHQKIDYIITRDYKCLSGGTEDKDGGEEEEDHTTKEENIIKREEEDLFTEENIQELLDAAANAEQR